MANKRQLKKAIRYACGDIAGECYFASQTFGYDKVEEWEKIIIDAALLQAEAVNRVSVDFDKQPKDFASGKEYKKARRTYFKQVEKALADYLHSEIEKIVNEMNALLPKASKE